MKKVISLALSMLMLVMLFAGCQSDSKPASSSAGNTATTPASSGSAESAPAAPVASGEKLKVGMMPYTVNVPAQYALDQGWFAEAGLDVEFVMFPNGTPMNESLAAKQIDMGVAGTAAVFSMVNGISTLVYETNTAGGMGLYVRADSPLAQVKGQIADKPDVLGSADTIRGIKVLGALGTVSQYTTIKYAELFGVKESEFEQIHMEFAQALQAFLAGEGDAISVPPPFSFQAAESGAVRAVSFEEAAGLTMKDGIIARKDVLADRRDDVVKFVQVYEKACDAFVKDPALRKEFSIKFFGANGFEYDDKLMEQEASVRDYINQDFIKQDGYVFGDSYTELANFFTTAGKIEEELLENLDTCFDPTVIKDAFGIDVKVIGK
ncbi:ABC transporter substrate-binding protein [Oscillospiraceae bacterium MB08-C2-2]|nr:ABC transporter substrate-binding protein [Oscillospiraceae bacterium MB08-C2-2]